MMFVVISCLLVLTFGLAMAEQPMECEYEGVMYENGPFQPDPCHSCYCDNGTADCSKLQCGWPICPNDERPIMSEDVCCPYCANGEK